MKKTLLLTRPRAASESTAVLAARHGFDCLIEPVLTITPTDASRPTGDFQAVLITSSNAPDALIEVKADISDLLNLPCYCVGPSTGGAAQSLGFTNIRCGESDSAALAQLVLQNLTDKTKPLLHIVGHVVDPKMAAMISAQGFNLTSWIVYHAEAIDDFSATTLTAFTECTITAIPVFSPRSARILVSLIEKNHLTQACSRIIAIGLSQAVADVLQILPWRSLSIAATPTEESVFVCLEKTMTQNDVSSGTPAPLLKKTSRKGGFILWGLLSLMGAAVLGGFALLNCPFFQPLLPTASGDATQLEHRLEIVETKIDKLTEIQPATPKDDNAALAETVKNLQAQIAELQNKKNTAQDNQQSAGVALAYMEMRDEARAGHDFSVPLAALVKAAGDNAAIKAQTTRLEAFAASPPPSSAELRSLLEKEEAHTQISVDTDSPEWLTQIKKTMRPLIAVHPLHNPQFIALENALEKNDAQGAVKIFGTLPQDIKTKLSDWQTKLQARATIDEALHELAISFAPTATGEKP